MSITRQLLLAGIVTALTAAGSCAPATTDRPASDGGRMPDQRASTKHVTVYSSPDDVPNVVTMCVGKHGFITTLSGGDAGDNKGAVLVRFEELDPTCT